MNDYIRRFHHLIIQNENHRCPSVETNIWQRFRANWRSNTRFPWQLPQIPAGTGCDSNIKRDGIVNIGGGRGSEVSCGVTPETLFLDITFDLLLIPSIDCGKDGESYSCHVLNDGDWKDENEEGKGCHEEKISIAIAVATRIGALLAVPSSQCGGRRDARGNYENVECYQYFYQRGNPLTASDIFQHCRSVDVDPEETDAFVIADLMADSFLKGCGHTSVPLTSLGNDSSDNECKNKRKPWQVMVELEENSATADTSFNPEGPKKQWKWYLKLRHESLQEEGILPWRCCNNEGTIHCQTLLIDRGDQNTCSDQNNDNITLYFGEPIGRHTLDMITLQPNSNINGGNCIHASNSEERLLWKQLNPSILESLYQPSDPICNQHQHSDSFQQPHQGQTSAAIAAGTNATSKASFRCQDDYLIKEKTSKLPAAPTSVASASNTPQSMHTQERRNDNLNLGNNSQQNNHERNSKNKPVSLFLPQETTLFARGKKTSIVGIRRKKAKFTLGCL